MTARRNSIDDAGRRASRQLRDVHVEGRRARFARGLSQAQVAIALACSRQLIGAIEASHLDDVGVIQLARYCAAVGLDLPFRAYPGTSPLRDAGQLRLLGRFRAAVGGAWTWRTEVPVNADPRDLRAIDALLTKGAHRVGVEAITRLADAQGQVRPIMLKQEAARLRCMLLVLADSRTNRQALRDGAPTISPAFPMRARGVLAELRAGRQPGANGVILL
jgi:transcriptional regulator with XRE-family HTH domain